MEIFIGRCLVSDGFIALIICCEIALLKSIVPTCTAIGSLKLHNGFFHKIISNLTLVFVITNKLLFITNIVILFKDSF